MVTESSKTHNIAIILGETDTDIIKRQAHKYYIELTFDMDNITERLVSLNKLHNMIDENSLLQLEYGQYIGYNTGVIDTSVETASIGIGNIKQVADGKHNDVSNDALSMFSTMWYEIARAEIDGLGEIVTDMYSIMNEIIQNEKDKDVFQGMSHTKH